MVLGIASRPTSGNVVVAVVAAPRTGPRFEAVASRKDTTVDRATERHKGESVQVTGHTWAGRPARVRCATMETAQRCDRIGGFDSVVRSILPFLRRVPQDEVS